MGCKNRGDVLCVGDERLKDVFGNGRLVGEREEVKRG